MSSNEPLIRRPMVGELLFMRHAESVYNVLGLCNADPAVAVPLTDWGRLQAESAAERLAAIPIDLIYVSELPRARETAEIVNRRHGAPLRIDVRLNDRCNGFEGRPVADYLAAVSHDPLYCRPQGGETYQELKARVGAFLDELANEPAQGVLVVSHHEVLQVAYGHFAGSTDEQMWHYWIGHADFFEARFLAR
jgi:broad specificity phosphatase PhoE